MQDSLHSGNQDSGSDTGVIKKKKDYNKEPTI
jgi:hypothetical protein